MTTSTKLKAFIGSILMLTGLFGLTTQAIAQEFQGEVFVCNYLGDADVDDVLKARDNYVKVAEKAGITLPPSYLWSYLKGGSDADMLWFNFYGNASQYGTFTDASLGSTDMVTAVDRFYDVLDCKSFLLSQQEVYNGGEEFSGEQVYVDSYGCNFRDGAGAASLPDLKSHIKSYLDSAGTHKSFILFQQDSMTPTANTPDVRFFGVHNNAADWGMRQDNMAANKDGQMLLRHWNSVLNCSASHWSSQQVIEGPPAE